MNVITQRKVAAILEVFGIYAAGQLFALILANILGIPLYNPITDLTIQSTPPELQQITLKLLGVLFVQYAGWFIPIFFVGWWYRKRTLKQYGLTLSSMPLKFYILAGILLFSFSELPVQILALLNSIHPLGEQTAWREAIYQISWNSLEFWLLMAVGSFGLIPILEELFYRGYVQTRFEEDFGAPTAILATTVLFALSHSQYYILNAYNLGMLAAIILSTLAYGYLFYRTRSLLVTVIAHMLINIPVKGAIQWILPVLMLLVCILAWKEIYKYLSDFMQLMRDMPSTWQNVAVVGVVALFAIGYALFGDIFILLGILFLLAALVLEWFDKRRIRNMGDAIKV
jgi:membrane protease YdiL (CAAX protease family)